MTGSAAPSVSILIPVHNREQLVGPCIESALAQSFCDLEVVVGDNASTDRTWDVCQHFARQDPRVHPFRNDENLGPVRNWARCAERARGRLGKLLFSDDLLHRSYLERTVPQLDDPRIGLVFTAALLSTEPWQGGRVQYSFPEWAGGLSSSDYLKAALVEERTPVSPGAALLRLSDLRRNLLMDVPSPSLTGFSRTGAGIDLLIYLLTAAQYPRLAHVPEPLAYFRDHPASITISQLPTVHRQYTQARIWFAERHAPGEILRGLLLRAWWHEVDAEQRWQPFAATAARYSATETRLTPRDRVWLALRYLKFWRGRLRRALRAQRAGSKASSAV